MMLRKLVAFVVVLLSSSLSWAQVERFVEGVAYFPLKETQSTQVAEGKVEVLEIFSYVCSHCGTLDPHLVRWEADKPEAAELRYLPAVWNNPGWVEYAAVFFTAQQMGIIKQSHHALMNRLWVQNKPPKDLNEVAAFHAEFGVSADEFAKIMQSPEISAKLQAAAQQVGKYEVGGTPTLIVDGRWRFDMTSAGGPEKIGELINFLVAKALSERAGQPAKAQGADQQG
jgi:thiol:disulfide interchange protein DsbA